MTDKKPDYGLYAFFGIINRNKEWITGYFSKVLGISPTVISYPDNQSLFYYTNDGDLAETADAVSIKIGFARSASGKPLSSKELLLQQLVKPDGVKADSLSGNFTVATLSKLTPRLSAYQSLLALPQIFYTLWEGGILCSTSTRVLLEILQKVEFNEEVIPALFFFRNLSGPRTFFRNVNRLFIGELLTWCDNQPSVKLLRTLKFPENNELIKKIDDSSVSALSDKLTEIMGSYVSEIKGRGNNLGNLLSGGVDSSTTQVLINRNLPASEKPISFSYIWDEDSFQFEVDYAKTSSNLLNTQHIFYQIPRHEYADNLVNAVATLAQPSVFLVNSAKYILAKHIRDKYPSIQHFFDGQCADCLFGIAYVRSSSFRHAEFFHNMPASYALLHFALAYVYPAPGKSRFAGLMKSFSSRDTYSSVFIPRKFLTTNNRFGVGDTIDFHRRVFGDKALLDCLDYRCNLLSRYSKCATPAEQIHDIELITGGYESAVHNYSFFISQYKNEINFYLDYDVMRLIKSFAPEIRYLQGEQVKPIIKKILYLSSLAKLVDRPKGGSGLDMQDIYNLLKTGALKDLTRAIDRPDFLSKREFDNLMEKTEVKQAPFLWDLLIYDIFQKQARKIIH